MYEISEVDGVEWQETLADLNARSPDIFPPLQPRHFSDGYWWIAFLNDDPVAFAGLVPFEPFPNVGYLKRCYVAPDHHGHGLQYRLMAMRELCARQLGWTLLVSECRADNSYSAANFRKAGFSLCEPEQRWADQDNSLYWVKHLTV